MQRSKADYTYWQQGFLKKPERIEVLGAILLMVLLIWNLIEHVLRQHVLENDAELPGRDNKKTRRPTAFMMNTMFAGLQIVRFGAICRLASVKMEERSKTRPLSSRSI